MTISSTTVVTRTNTNGSTHTFNFSHPFGDPDDLLVYLVTIATGAAALQTKDTHYTVSNTGGEAESGGTVTFINGLGVATAPATGKVVVILRDPELVQDFAPSGSYPSRGGMEALDRIYQIMQHLEWNRARSIRLPVTEADATLELPVLGDRVSKALEFDADGNLTVGATAADLIEVNTDTLAEVQAAAAAAALSQTSAANSATAAANYAGSAGASATAAQTAENNAETAETHAETAQAAAEAAQAGAGASETAAAASASAAASSAAAAASSASAASTSASTASLQAGNASTSASAASGSASTATTQAGIATTQAGNAATSAGNAANSASDAADSADDAAVSAAAAAASAASLTTEALQDLVGAMVSGNTETGIAVTYQDSDGTLDFEVNGVLEDLNTLGAPASDGQFIVATGAGAFAYESGTTARASMGVSIGSQVQAYAANLDEWATLNPSANGGSLVTAADYATMRTLLGLVISTNVQAYDADLTTWAGLAPSANHQTLVTQTFAQMRASLDLEGGTDFYSIAAADAAFQPKDASLTAYAALTTAANKGVYFSAADTPVTYDLTAFGRALGGYADEAAFKAGVNLEIGVDVQAYDADLTTWAGLTPSANFQTLVAQTFAQMRGSLDLEAGTDFYSISAADAAFQPKDADLTAVAALTTTAAGRSILTFADPNADRLVAWDDSAGTAGPIALADIASEGAPAAGDYMIVYLADGSLAKVDWDDLPGAAGGISNVVEDTSPQLGGNLDLNGHVITGLVIGTNVQAYDADLSTWAGLTPSANAQSLVTAASYAAMRALLDLEAGTDFYSISAANAAFQPIDGDLTSWAGVTRASGFDTFAATPSSANLKTLVTDETGSGALVFATSPALVTPDIGIPSAGTLTNCTGLPTAGLVNDAVTYAKMQNISAQYRLLGRSSSGAGDTEEITTSAFSLTLLDDADAATALATLTAMGQGLHTIYIPAGAMVAAATAGPASASLDSGTQDVNYKVLDFDASADEHAHFNIMMPKNWDEGTITFQVVWSTAGAVTTGVAWGLQAIALSDNEAIDTAFGTPVVVTDDAQSAAGEIYVTAVSSAVTVGGSPAADDIVFFRIFRDISDANDDMTQDARLIGVKILHTINAATDA